MVIGDLMMMTKAQAEDYIGYLQLAIKDLKEGSVAWMAYSLKYNDGSSVAIHSKDAPKRPRGLS